MLLLLMLLLLLLVLSPSSPSSSSSFRWKWIEGEARSKILSLSSVAVAKKFSQANKVSALSRSDSTVLCSLFQINLNSNRQLLFQSRDYFSHAMINRDSSMIFRVTDKNAHLRESLEWPRSTDRTWKCMRAVNWCTDRPDVKQERFSSFNKLSYQFVLSSTTTTSSSSTKEIIPIHHMTRHGDCREMCGTIEDPFQQTVHPSYPQ